MTIAVNTRFLIANRLEGIGWYSYELLKEMVAQHPDDEFLFFFDRPYPDEFIFGPNVRGYVLRPPARHPVLWLAWFEWSLARALRRHRADVLLSPDGYLSLRSPVKTVMVTHDIAHVHFPGQVGFFTRKYYDYFVPRFLKRADAVITVSEFTKRDILAHYPVEPKKIHPIYNGCRSGFVPLSEKEKAAVRQQYAGGQPYFFYVGAIQPRKNVHRLIGAFDRFKEQTGSPMKLLIGGRLAWQTGEVTHAYNNAVHKLDISFLGYLNHEEVPRLMGAAFALTYVSLFEGFGLPLVEAMYCEVPFITADVSSMPEVAGSAGLLVPPHDVEAIGEAMVRLYNDPDLYRQLLESGREERGRFRWDSAAEQAFQVLNSII